MNPMAGRERCNDGLTKTYFNIDHLPEAELQVRKLKFISSII